jgi:hypothetical protein
LRFVPLCENLWSLAICDFSANFETLVAEDLVLDDAMHCLGLSGGYKKFKRDFEERRWHAQEINKAIQDIFAKF